MKARCDQNVYKVSKFHLPKASFSEYITGQIFHILGGGQHETQVETYSRTRALFCSGGGTKNMSNLVKEVWGN